MKTVLVEMIVIIIIDIKYIKIIHHLLKIKNCNSHSCFYSHIKNGIMFNFNFNFILTLRYKCHFIFLMSNTNKVKIELLLTFSSLHSF
jgi:hypothetical protein